MGNISYLNDNNGIYACTYIDCMHMVYMCTNTKTACIWYICIQIHRLHAYGIHAYTYIDCMHMYSCTTAIHGTFSIDLYGKERSSDYKETIQEGSPDLPKRRPLRTNIWISK